MGQSNTKKSNRKKISKKEKRSPKTAKPNNSTVYDDVFRTIEVRCPKLMIPLINEAFSENYSLYDKILPLANEHFSILPDDEQKKRATDSNISIIRNGKIKRYHFECQSTVDSHILIRFCEYGSQIALEDNKIGEDFLHVNYPLSALLYLRSNSYTPDTMDIKVNMSITPGIHRVVVIKLNKYSLDEIFEKQLWILLPFYIFTYENRFAEYEADAKLRNEMISEFKLIIEHLNTLELNKEINSWERSVLLSLTRRVIRKITVNNDNIRKELINIMGGKVLYDTEMDIAWRKGLKKGISEGRAKGEREGRLETLFSLYEDGFLTEDLLLSRAEKESILDEAMEKLRQYK